MKKTFLKLFALIMAMPILFSGCATILSKSSYPVSINTTPAGANISITNKKGKEVYKGQTPSIVTLKSGAGYFSKAEYKVRLTSTGYAEQVIPVTFKLNGWYFGNIIFGGLIGLLIVDPATGAMWKLDTPPINVTLSQSTTSIREPTLNILDIKDVSQSMRDHLVRVK